MNRAALAGKLWLALPPIAREPIIWLTQGFYSVGVSAVVLDDQNRVLLVQNHHRDEGHWTIPGGFLKPGETPRDAIAREVREETGFEVRVGPVVQFAPHRRTHLGAEYLTWITGGHLAINGRELLDARFFALTDLPPNLAPISLSAIQAAVRTLDGRGD